MTETPHLKMVPFQLSFPLREISVKPKYKHVRKDEFRIMPVSVMDSRGLYSNTGHVLWTLSYVIH